MKHTITLLFTNFFSYNIAIHVQYCDSYCERTLSRPYSGVFWLASRFASLRLGLMVSGGHSKESRMYLHLVTHCLNSCTFFVKTCPSPLRLTILSLPHFILKLAIMLAPNHGLVLLSYNRVFVVFYYCLKPDTNPHVSSTSSLLKTSLFQNGFDRKAGQITD